MTTENDPAPPRARSRADAMLTVIAVGVLGALLFLLRDVLLPLFVAFFLSYLGMPVQRFLERLRCPRGLAICLVILTLGGGLTGLGYFFYSSAHTLVDEVSRYERQFEKGLCALEDIFERFKRRDGEPAPDGMTGGAASAGAAAASEGEAEGGSPLHDELMTLLTGNQVLNLFGSVLGGLTDLFLVLTFLVFILVDRGRESLDKRIVQAFSDAGTESARPTVLAIHKDIENYIVTKTLLSMATGLLSWMTMAAFGLPFAPLFAILVFLFNYVPNVGSIIATVLPTLFALLHFSDDPLMVAAMGAILAGIQVVIGNVVEPYLVGKRLHLNPTTVLLALVVWGFLWGVWGMVLSVPLMATIRIILVRSRALPAVATLMSSSED